MTPIRRNQTTIDAAVVATNLQAIVANIYLH